MPISDYLLNDKKYIAHIDGKNKDGVLKNPETIEEHSSLALDYAKRIIKVQHLEPVLKKLGEKFFQNNVENFELWQQMFFDAIYLHDLGKANTDFQSLKMKNKNFNSSPNKNSEHSLSSASLYFSKYFEQINNLSDKKVFFLFLLINCFVISKHHGYLKSFEDFLDNFADTNIFFEIYKNLLPEIKLDFSVMNDEKKLKIRKGFAKSSLENFEESERFKTIDLYIYTKLLYSLLVSADFYATSDYMNDYKPINPEDFGVITNVDKFLEPFTQTEIYKSIQNYSRNRKSKDFKNINEARSEMFLEAEENLLNNLDKNLFYLEAPTGSGKTNTAINLSLKLVKNCPNINKIFYVFPFNTLVEQTKNTLLKSFGDNATIGNEIGVINSITPIYNEDEKSGKVEIKTGDIPVNQPPVDYNQILMGRQFLHYPIVVTTHVKLFDWFFGLGRESHFPICQLANSVVILDEIQSYKNSIWQKIAIFLNRFADILNIKIIIMSATLPKIGALIPKSEVFNQTVFQNLILDRKKYFESEWFKNRVIPNFDFLEEFKTLEEDEKIYRLQEKIYEEYKNGKDILVEFINKKRSLEFFKDFKERYQDKISLNSIQLLNGDDNLYTRNQIISEVKNSNRDYNVILFSTQVIEAGVDIDFDVGFKDISILDAEEQFMGRINRSCKKSGCCVYFFNLDKTQNIYKEDYRTEFSLENKEIQEHLKNKDFEAYYKLVLNKLEDCSVKNTEENLEYFRKNILQTLDFEKVKDRLKLLKDDNSYTVFLNRTLKINDKSLLVGKEVWQRYKKLLENSQMEYAQKQIELSKINQEISYFTYSVRKIIQNYNDVIGDIYYFENGEDFLTDDGKFDREKFKDEKSNFEIL